MDYHFTALSAERFQSFCQALLAKKFDRVQCFPTGQPDGGRDAGQRMDTDLADTTVYQVKFSKNPSAKSEREIVESLIVSEKSKVMELVQRGAKQYIFMTNVKGTAHKDSGSIDRVNKILTAQFDIPVFCYWEDELSRELDGSLDIKWSYPELLKATDLLEQLVFSNASDLGAHQRSAIIAFLTTQYRDDAKLKFKQVEIKENIIDLFVDVPAEISLEKRGGLEVKTKLSRGAVDKIHSSSNVQQTLSSENQKFDEREDGQASAYQILTNADFVSHSKRVVVEGAPGQGKSTITQFLCQVHRISFLNKVSDQNKLKSVFRPNLAAIPIRVDIRDYASWLSGFNPFVVNEVSRPQFESDALESFLAWMISQTTGSNFTTNDLNIFFGGSRLLVVLDGFDEVAELKVREQIVEQVSAAAERLEALCVDFQIIVTSRPAAFANSPGFPRDEWTYVQLQSLTKGVINQYANQWLGGGIKDEKDKIQILTVLNSKLSQPHIRDLARNPMQLAILLSLISVQGASLPDQRTALYDRYIDIFFNRESEKSITVRDNRATLIEIHQYLAWKLHSESEVKGDGKTLAGSISKTDLIVAISRFLTSRGHEQSIVDELFTGLVERVVALVSRTQDTFEFEVQPLREYFAARWLYVTSPYSPVGRVVRGTRTERFDAISRNFFWQNVARFMAGCYDIGELASLEESVTSLAEDEVYSNLAYPAFLGMTLLNDYIFEQQPRLADRLVARLIKTKSFERLIWRDVYGVNGHIFDVTEKSGRTRIIEHLKAGILQNRFGHTELFQRGRYLRVLLPRDSVKSYWIELREEINDDRVWMRLGSVLDVFRELSPAELLKIYEEVGQEMFFGLVGRFKDDFLERYPQLWSDFLKLKLNSPNGNFGIMFRAEMKRGVGKTVTYQKFSSYVFMCFEYLPFVYTGISDEDDTRCLGDRFLDFGIVDDFGDTSEFSLEQPKLVELYDLISELMLRKANLVFDDIDILNELFFRATEIWGLQNFILSRALFLTDRIKSAPKILRHDFSRSQIISFFANLRFGEPSMSHWNSLLAYTGSDGPKLHPFIISAMSSWAPDHIVFDRDCILFRCIDDLSERETLDLNVIEAEVEVTDSDDPDADNERIVIGRGGELSERVFRIFLSRFKRAEVEILLEQSFEFDNLKDDLTLGAVCDFCLDVAFDENRNWDRALTIAKVCHIRKIKLHYHRELDDKANIPEEFAREILLEPDIFPDFLSVKAERALNDHVGRSMKPIAEIATTQKWFGLDGLPEI